MSRPFSPVRSVILVLVVLFAVERHFAARGSEKLLRTMQSIRQGDSKESVRTLLGGKPSVTPASSLPDWIKQVVPERTEGEYWYRYMGYPPRLIIIYFGADEKVAYVTWTTT